MVWLDRLLLTQLQLLFHATSAASCLYSFNLWLPNVLFPFPQSISPGLVRTEFRGRATNAKDLEQSKKDYDKICAEVCCITLFQ